MHLSCTAARTTSGKWPLEDSSQQENEVETDHSQFTRIKMEWHHSFGRNLSCTPGFQLSVVFEDEDGIGMNLGHKRSQQTILVPAAPEQFKRTNILMWSNLPMGDIALHHPIVIP